MVDIDNSGRAKFVDIGINCIPIGNYVLQATQESRWNGTPYCTGAVAEVSMYIIRPNNSAAEYKPAVGAPYVPVRSLYSCRTAVPVELSASEAALHHFFFNPAYAWPFRDSSGRGN